MTLLYAILLPNRLLQTESPRSSLTAEARPKLPCEAGRLSSAALGTRKSPVQSSAPDAMTSPSSTHRRNLSGAVEPAGPVGGAVGPGQERGVPSHTCPSAWPQALEAVWASDQWLRQIPNPFPY